MSAGKYDILLFAEHGFYPPALEPQHRIHDRMCVINKGTFTHLSYNTNYGTDTEWNQYSGTVITLNKDMRAKKAKDSVGGDPTKLGRWTWTKICGKAVFTTVFVSIYRSCHNPDGMHTVWSQQACYFKDHKDIEQPDIHALFIKNLCKFLGDLCDNGHNVVLGMDANDDVHDGKVTKTLMEIGMYKTVISNHGGESASATCATNKQRKPIDSIWTSPALK